MNPAETVALCRYAKAVCPQQAIDEYTPDAWHDLLGDLRFEDAKEAIARVARSQPFVAPSEIRTEVKRMRRNRVLEFGVLPDPPPELDPDNAAAYIAWQRATTRAIADGTPPPRPEAIPARNPAEIRALLAGARGAD